jgi:hypothetical protein
VARFASVPVCLLFAATALAQEAAPPAPSKSAPPTEDAIAAAKRDFNAIKGARSALEQPKADLPSMSAPELQTAPAMPRPLTNPKLDPKAAKKSANWLVDAMMAPDEKESRDPSRTPGESLRRTRESLDENDPQAATDPRATAAKDEEMAVASKRTAPDVNPLTRYMAGLMTPQDYALLKPGLDGAAAASLASRGDPSLPTVGAAVSGVSDTVSALELGADTKPAPFALPKPADNPFLQAFNQGGGSAPVVLAAPPTPSSAPSSPIFAPTPAPVAPANSKIPDFAKPAMDEKYFKQLKRF